MGLFAYDKTKADDEIIFKPNDDICNYFGQVVTKEILDERYGNYTAPYGIEVSANQNKYEDTATQRGIGSLINHRPKSRTNCRFVNNYQFIKIRAHKNIRNGAKLFINYGRDYRFNDEVEYSTNTKVRTL
jgi:SET domain-containing protein